MPSVRDHRGRVCEVTWVGDWSLLAYAGELDEKVLASMEREAESRPTDPISVLYVATLAGHVLLFIMIVTLAKRWGVPKPAAMSIASVCAAASFWFFARRLGYTGVRRVVPIALEHGLCPACAYPIAGVGEQGDGCTVCPECGGAWRVNHQSVRPGPQ